MNDNWNSLLDRTNKKEIYDFSKGFGMFTGHAGVLILYDGARRNGKRYNEREFFLYT